MKEGHTHTQQGNQYEHAVFLDGLGNVPVFTAKSPVLLVAL